MSKIVFLIFLRFELNYLRLRIYEDIKVFKATNQEVAAIPEIAPLETLENLFHLARMRAERKCLKSITNAIQIAAQATQS